MKILFLFFASLVVCIGKAQVNPVVQSCVNQVSLPLLKQMINEFTGEVSTTVAGQQVTIKNRVSASSAGNNVAADYIKEKLTSYGLTPVEQNYSSGGRNIYAIQKGKVNPDNIFIIGGHYDAVANYCADDNATGTITALEAARILSKESFENTIIYAFWDEEETGLNGSDYFAKNAVSEKMNIKGVLSIDMNGYDSNSDNQFDIDYRNVAQSSAMKDLIMGLIPTYNFSLTCHPVISKQDDSDHASFLNRGITCIFLGECWDKKDVTPYYHSSNDRASTLNWPYYNKLVQLSIAYIATVAVPIMNKVENIAGTFKDRVSIYPNPVQNYFIVALDNIVSYASVDIADATGKVIYSTSVRNSQSVPVNFNSASGIYFITVKAEEEQAVFKLIKQ